MRNTDKPLGKLGIQRIESLYFAGDINEQFDKQLVIPVLTRVKLRIPACRPSRCRRISPLLGYVNDLLKFGIDEKLNSVLQFGFACDITDVSFINDRLIFAHYSPDHRIFAVFLPHIVFHFPRGLNDDRDHAEHEFAPAFLAILLHDRKICRLQSRVSAI